MGLFLDSYKEKYEEQLELQNLKSIYVDSPLFKEKITNNTIYILLRNNHPQYTNTFNELLKKKDIKYSSIYCIFDNNINTLKNLEIDFNKIKKITLDKGPEFNTDNNIIFQTLFSLNNIENTLISLNIGFRWNEEDFSNFLWFKSKIINSELFEQINNFKVLKYLYLYYIDFNKNVTIKLSNLKIFYCIECENLRLSDIICPKLKTLKYINEETKDINFKTFDFKNLKELKELYIDYYCKINVLNNIK